MYLLDEILPCGLDITGAAIICGLVDEDADIIICGGITIGVEQLVKLATQKV